MVWNNFVISYLISKYMFKKNIFRNENNFDATWKKYVCEVKNVAHFKKKGLGL